MKKRVAERRRKTTETNIAVKLTVDGEGESRIDTPIGLLNHMLELFAFHGLFDLEIKASGDAASVDIHHTNEDIGLVLGDVFKDALGDKLGIRRNGSASFPMEDVVADVVVDISGRGSFKEIVREPVGIVREADKDEDGYNLEYANHFFESFANKSGTNLSIRISGTNPDLHTNLEPVFKAFGKALDQATQIDPRRKGVPSTKGIID